MNAVTTALQAIEFRVHDASTRIFVKRPGDKHEEQLVDLISGECSCEHYQFRIAPHHERGRARPEQGNQCIHIALAREWFLEKMLDALEKAHGKG